VIRLHYLQHVAFEGLGSIAAWAAARQYSVAATRLYKGDRLPEQAAFDCRDEIVAGRFIQSAEQMLSQPDRFDTLNSLMASQLESLPLFCQDQM